MEVLIKTIDAYLQTTGGGEVFFPAGDYYCEGPTSYNALASNTTWRGEAGTNLICLEYPFQAAASYQTYKGITFGYENGYTGTSTSGTGVTYWTCYSVGSFGGSDTLIEDCTFLGGSPTHDSPTRLLVNNNTYIRCKGCIQSIGTSNGIIITNNTCYQSTDDTISCLGPYVVIANNMVDMGYPLIDASGTGIPVYGSLSTTITGNVVKNCANAGLAFWEHVATSSGVIMSNNVVDNCVTGLNLSEPSHQGNVFTSNVFSNCGQALFVNAPNNIFSGNIYLNNTNPNFILGGNIIMDQDTTSPNVDSIFWNGRLMTMATTSQGPNDVLFQSSADYTGTWSAESYTGPWVGYTPPTTGAYIASISWGVGYAPSDLPGCVLQITCAGPVDSGSHDGSVTNVLFTSAEFTIPMTVGSITDTVDNPDLPISIGYFAAYVNYNIRLVTPGNVPVDIRQGTAHSTNHDGYTNSGGDVALTLQGYDYTIYGSPSNIPIPFAVFGEQGNNKGQMTLGPTGSPLSQISMYEATGTYPSVAANSEMIVTVAVTSVTGATPVTTDQIFVTSTGPVPAGLMVGNSYCATNGSISFKVANFSVIPYSNADPYDLWFQGLSQ